MNTISARYERLRAAASNTRKRKRWDLDEVELARTWEAEGFDYAQIGQRLGRSAKAVRAAIKGNLVHPHADYSKLGRGDKCFIRPSERTLAEREMRTQAQEARSIVGALMGDPPPGYSALDRRDAVQLVEINVETGRAVA